MITSLLLLSSCSYDLTLTTPIRDVTKLESRSVFHVPVSAVNSPPPPLDTQQFGVPLDDLRVRYNGDPVPPVLKMCVHAIEEKGECVCVQYNGSMEEKGECVCVQYNGSMEEKGEWQYSFNTV